MFVIKKNTGTLPGEVEMDSDDDCVSAIVILILFKLT